MPGFVQKLVQLHSQKPGNSSNGAQTISSLNMWRCQNSSLGVQTCHMSSLESQRAKPVRLSSCDCRLFVWVVDHSSTTWSWMQVWTPQCTTEMLLRLFGVTCERWSWQSCRWCGCAPPCCNHVFPSCLHLLTLSQLDLFSFSPSSPRSLSLSYAHILPPVLFLTSLDRVSVVCIYL